VTANAPPGPPDSASEIPSKTAGQRRFARFKSLLFYILILILAGVIGNWWMTRDQAAGKAPEFQLENLKGEKVRVDYGQFNGPMLVYFFADWCPICKFQNGAISAVAEDNPVLGIGMQSGDNEQLRQYAEQHGLTFPILNDRNGNISRLFGVHGVPASFIIDNNGHIRYSTRGYSPALSLQGRLWLTKKQD
jgi:peroxiredoxin